MNVKEDTIMKEKYVFSLVVRNDLDRITRTVRNYYGDFRSAKITGAARKYIHYRQKISMDKALYEVKWVLLSDFLLCKSTTMLLSIRYDLVINENF